MKIKAIYDEKCLFSAVPGPEGDLVWCGRPRGDKCLYQKEMEIAADTTLSVTLPVALSGKGIYLIKLDAYLVKKDAWYGYEAATLSIAGWGSHLASARRRFWLSVQEYFNSVVANPDWDEQRIVEWLKGKGIELKPLEADVMEPQYIPTEEIKVA